MTREEAERERDRMAAEHPESTWLASEADGGEWQVVKVGLKPADSATGTTTEGRAKPPHPDDARTSLDRNVGGPWAAGG